MKQHLVLVTGEPRDHCFDFGLNTVYNMIDHEVCDVIFNLTDSHSHRVFWNYVDFKHGDYSGLGTSISPQLKNNYEKRIRELFPQAEIRWNSFDQMIDEWLLLFSQAELEGNFGNRYMTSWSSYVQKYQTWCAPEVADYETVTRTRLDLISAEPIEYTREQLIPHFYPQHDRPAIFIRDKPHNKQGVPMNRMGNDWLFAWNRAAGKRLQTWDMQQWRKKIDTCEEGAPYGSVKVEEVWTRVYKELAIDEVQSVDWPMKYFIYRDSRNDHPDDGRFGKSVKALNKHGIKEHSNYQHKLQLKLNDKPSYRQHRTKY